MRWTKPIVVYVALAYLISWFTFILLALNHNHIIFVFPDDAIHARIQDIWHSMGALGPILAAFVTVMLLYNKNGRQQFFSGYSIRKINGKGWLLSLSPLIIFAVSLLLNRIVAHEWFDISRFFQINEINQPFNLLAWFLPILCYGFGEEAGWRGYALPALQSKYSAFTATMILSIIWVCWHIPSFFYRYDLKGVAYIGFVLGVIAGAIWLTFLFNYTRGSILAVSVWHFTFNAVSMIGKDELVISATMSFLIMLMAAFVLLKYKFEDLSPFQKTTLRFAAHEDNLARNATFT